MAPRCLARQACLALCAGVAAFALIGCGGGGPTSKVEKACAISFHNAVATLEQRYNDTNVKKCTSLRQSNEDKLGTEERGADFEQQCVTKANAEAAQYMEAHEANYTGTCIAEVSNVSNASNLDDLILHFEEVAVDLADLIIAPQLEGTYDKLIDGISSGGGNSSESGSEGGSSGSDIVVTEAPAEKPAAANKTEAEKAPSSSTSGSANATEPEDLRLFEDHVGANTLSSGSSLRLPAVSAGLAALLLVASWATAKAVRRSQRRTSYDDLEVTLE